MLSFRQLDDLPEAVVEIWGQTQQEIIDDMARRIAQMGGITDATLYQMERLYEIGAVMAKVQEELAKALNKTQAELIRLFDEAATRTLAADDRIYRAAGLSPIPLPENPYMQQIIWAGLEKTMGEFVNLTGTIANTATGQFEAVLDLAHQRIVTGAFDYQSAIKMAIRELAGKGIMSIQYPSGHIDHMDVATRRAALTGASQTASKLQERRFEEMGAEFVETTAHASARPSHAEWQGRVFYWNRRGLPNNTGYPDFIESTGYGEGAGLCGWNCRHSFYPYYPGISETANTREQIEAMNNKTVNYNGKKMDLYEATQRQRYIERQIRRWKREGSAMDAAGLDSSAATAKIRSWQAAQRDFIKQTGLSRDYFRERGGAQLSGVRSGGILNDISSGRYPITRDSLSTIPTYELDRYSGELLRSQQAKLLESIIGKPIITEASAYYSLDGRYLAGGVGLDGRAPAYNISQPHVSIHNHPSGLTFSEKDLDKFIRNPNTIILSAIGNNGVSYVLERAPGFDSSNFIRHYINRMKLSEHLSFDDYVKLMEEILREADGFGFTYYR